MNCDFCNSDAVVASFDAADLELFTLDTITHVSEGGWAACTACADLVLDKDVTGLAERVVQSVPWGEGDDGAIEQVLISLYTKLLPELTLNWRIYEVE